MEDIVIVSEPKRGSIDSCQLTWNCVLESCVDMIAYLELELDLGQAEIRVLRFRGRWVSRGHQRSQVQSIVKCFIRCQVILGNVCANLSQSLSAISTSSVTARVASHRAHAPHRALFSHNIYSYIGRPTRLSPPRSGFRSCDQD